MKRLPFSFMPNAPLAVMLVSLTALSACGGGGSGGDSTPQPPVAGQDTIAPVITLNGANPLKTYIDSGATALDAVDGAVAVLTDGSVNENALGDYIIYYSAKDKAGNEATSTREVTVVDLTAPVITLNGESVITLGAGRDYVELGATAMDNVDGAITVHAPTGNLDTNTQGTYTLTYTVGDASNNVASLVRTINIIEPRPFITTWQTTVDNDSIEIREPSRIDGTEVYDFYVDWGDGSPVQHVIKKEGVPHPYAKAGTYTVQISGQLPALDGCRGYEDKLLSVEQWGDIQWRSLKRAFKDCRHVVFNDDEQPDMRLVTSMVSMVEGATHFNSDISGWDVSGIENMLDIFYATTDFDQDLSGWDISSVTEMGRMFENAGLSQANYDATLIGWSQQTVQPNVFFHGGNSVHSSVADKAVEILEGQGWTITEGGAPAP